MDIIKPFTDAPSILETRLTKLELVNHLDSKGLPGTPGKYNVTIHTVDEQQKADRSPIFLNSIPVRTDNPDIVFDPMLYASVEFTREDGSKFYFGSLLQDLILVIDTLKGGLPQLAIPPEPEPEPTPDPEVPAEG